MRTTLTLANPSIVISQQTTMLQCKTKKKKLSPRRRIRHKKFDLKLHRNKFQPRRIRNDFYRFNLKVDRLIFAHTVQLFNQIFQMCTHVATKSHGGCMVSIWMMISICKLQLEPFLGALVPIFRQNLGLTREWFTIQDR